MLLSVDLQLVIFLLQEKQINQSALLVSLFLAPHMSLLPSVICKCVGLDNYTRAFGTLFLFRGFTSIIGPPAAGSFLSFDFIF